MRLQVRALIIYFVNSVGANWCSCFYDRPAESVPGRPVGALPAHVGQAQDCNSMKPQCGNKKQERSVCCNEILYFLYRHLIANKLYNGFAIYDPAHLPAQDGTAVIFVYRIEINCCNTQVCFTSLGKLPDVALYECSEAACPVFIEGDAAGCLDAGASLIRLCS